jgi:hypothetical protein
MQVTSEVILLPAGANGIHDANVFVAQQRWKHGALPLPEVSVGVSRATTRQLHAQQDGARRRIGHRKLLNAEASEWPVQDHNTARRHVPQPFTAPAVRPAAYCSTKKEYTSATGIEPNSAPAISGPQK